MLGFCLYFAYLRVSLLPSESSLPRSLALVWISPDPETKCFVTGSPTRAELLQLVLSSRRILQSLIDIMTIQSLPYSNEFFLRLPFQMGKSYSLDWHGKDTCHASRHILFASVLSVFLPLFLVPPFSADSFIKSPSHCTTASSKLERFSSKSCPSVQIFTQTMFK